MLSCKLPGMQRLARTVRSSSLRPRQHALAHRLPLSSYRPQAPSTPKAAPVTTALVVDPSKPEPLAGLAKAGALVGLALALTLASDGAAHAANTGGRVGGSGFESRRQSSYSSGSHTSPSHTTVHHTSVTVVQSTPSFGFGWGMPAFFMPVGGFGYGHSSASPMLAILMILLLVVLMFMAFQMFSGMNRQPEEELYGFNPGEVIRNRPSGCDSVVDGTVEEEAPVTVAKLQVALLANARELRKDLDMLGARANTNSTTGLHTILQETVLSLMRHPEYCVYATSSASVFTDSDAAENSFNRLALEERSKFRQETLSNVGGVARSSTTLSNPTGVNELVVLTLVLATEGSVELPRISNAGDLKTALGKLGGVPASNLVGLELMWTPQAEGDSFTKDQLVMDYPTLMPL